MQVRFRQIHLQKRHPLRIARGVSSGSTNLFVIVEDDGVPGTGEMAPGSLTGCATAEEGERILRPFAAALPDDCPPREVARLGREAQIAPCALAALEMAVWDLRARQASLPLYKMLGLPARSVPTSVTIGINPVEVIRERVPEILARTGARALKIKLGSPDGIEADQLSFLAAREATAEAARRAMRASAGQTAVSSEAAQLAAAGVSPARGAPVALRVDANGGWNLRDARVMLRWLHQRGVDYVEQPLPYDHLEDLPELSRDRPLPIFLDESCRFASDIPAWAHLVDGVNLKLMKCGGITEALGIVATARAHGLQTMIGCMGESSIAISAGASLGALFDHIDLDSHLNLTNDPAEGAELIDGVVTPTARPGHGGRLLDA